MLGLKIEAEKAFEDTGGVSYYHVSLESTRWNS
jgi:hypothetical protein